MKKTNRKFFVLTIGIGLILVTMSFCLLGYENTWRLWNIPTLSPHFADSLVITAGAESKAMGYDPLIDNPMDPWQRKLNYPRIWQMLYLLGINRDHTLYFGIVISILFITGLF